MNFNEYQERAHKTSLNTNINGSELIYPILGLVDEAGEVVGKVKKLFRDGAGIITDEFKNVMIKELGDVQWYLAETCTKLGISLDEIAVQNINKLESRKERGKLQGSGDNR